MDCRTTAAHKFRTRLGFKQYDVILAKEQSVLMKIKSLFEGESIQTQYSVTRTKQNRLMLVSNCAVCGNIKSS